MLILFVLLNIGLLVFGSKLYTNKINPISIYSFIWVSVLVMYESGLLKFYELSIKTWIVIIVMQMFYVFGCYLGRKTIKLKAKQTTSNDVRYLKEERALRKTILTVSLISAIAIITNVVMSIKVYGINLLKATTEIYIDRVNNTQEFETVPYFGAFIFIAIILSGVYIKKYGVKMFLFFPIFLVCINQLTTGGRSSLVYAVLMLLAPIIFKAKGKTKIQRKIKKLSKFKLSLLSACFLGLLMVISQNRAEGQIVSSVYASDLMVNISNGNAMFYKLFMYMAAPVGVLNAYLDNPTFNFGGNTFLTLYNFLNKFGFDITTTQYQEFYHVPMRVNVGTYIRELIQDFTIAGALIVTLILGFVFSRSFLIIITKKSYMYEIWASTLFTLIVLSFFDWKLRSSTVWIILIFGSILGLWLDKKIKSTCVTEEKTK